MTFEIDGFTPIDILGRGGFGTVHRAADDAHGREVAVKVLGRITDDSARRRFDRERRAMGTLSGHPTIGIVYTSGFTKNEEPYIVMEMIRGGSLADRLDKDGPLTAVDVVALGVTLAEALDHAHEGGVLHLDLKPENILMSRFGQPKIVDFGIAALVDDESATSTIRATPSFADPEVLDGNPGTEQSDVYGLAATLFTLLDGTPPYSEGPSGLYQMMRRVAMDPVPTVERDGVPAELAALLRRAMAKNPAERPQTMGEFALLLAAVNDEAPTAEPADVEPVTARRPRRRDRPDQAGAPGQLAGWPAGFEERPRLPGEVSGQPVPQPSAEPSSQSWAPDAVAPPAARPPAVAPLRAAPQHAIAHQAVPSQHVTSGDWPQTSASVAAHSKSSGKPGGKQGSGMGAVVALSSLAVILAAVLAFVLIQRNRADTTADDGEAPAATLEEGGVTTEVATTEPDLVTTADEPVVPADGRVPDIVAMTTGDASQTLVDNGFEVSVPRHCFDVVSSQSPLAGVAAEPGDAVVLGYPPCVVPDFVGMRIDEAARIADEEFVVGLLVEWPPHCDDIVLAQSIPGGEIVQPGTTVFLTLEDDC